MNQMRRAGRFLRKERHLQQGPGGWLWLEQALERRDGGSGHSHWRKEGRVPAWSPDPVSLSFTPQTFTVNDDSCHFLTSQASAYPLLERYPVEAL